MAMRGSSAWRKQAWGPACKPTLVAQPIYAGGPKFQCEKRASYAFVLLGAVFLRHSYVVRRVGCYNCRKITGGTSMSSHSWATSLDVNDDTNPYRRDKLVTDMSRAMIADVYAIKTVEGVQVFRWGGDWDGRPETANSNYDAMHFEIVATPQELAVGFEHDLPAKPQNAISYPVLRRGAKGPLVIFLQNLVKLGNTTGVGEFGPRTEAAVIKYQKSRGLEADGIVGTATWTALITNQPSVAAIGGIPPQKGVIANV